MDMFFFIFFLLDITLFFAELRFHFFWLKQMCIFYQFIFFYRIIHSGATRGRGPRSDPTVDCTQNFKKGNVRVSQNLTRTSPAILHCWQQGSPLSPTLDSRTEEAHQTYARGDDCVRSAFLDCVRLNVCKSALKSK